MKGLGSRYVERIRRRLLVDNQNWLAVVCGDTGSGKSYSALALADAISPRGITVKRNVVFTPEQFLAKIKDTKKLQKGDFLIFDEAGVGMSARDWNTVQNKLLGAVLQTFRHLNVGVIFTVPNMSFMDVQARKLLHAYLQTVSIDRERNEALLDAYDLQMNSRLDKLYYHRPRFVDEHGCLVTLRPLAVPKMRASLLKEYEAAKEEYSQSLRDQAYADLTAPPKTGKREYDEEGIIQQIIQQPKEYLLEREGSTYIDGTVVSRKHDLPEYRARTVKRAVEQKLGIGYRVKSRSARVR